MINQESRQYKFLDLSGYMFSGKAAVIDLMREFEGYYVPNYRYEFPLIRIQDGIMDLEKALIDDWSPIRSDIAVKRFQKLVTKMSGHKRKWFSLKEEELVSWNYHQLYGEKFYQYSMDYIESLIDLKIKAVWPYYSMCEPFHEILKRRLKKLIIILSDMLKGHGLHNKLILDEIDLFIISGDEFYEKTKSFLEKILSIPLETVETDDVHTIVMHNAFEPFNPWRPIRYFKDAKCIIVDRDPRDIYLTSLSYSDGFNDNPGVYSKISCAFNVDYFIKRFVIYRNNANIDKDPKDRVLRIHFEKLVTEYEDTLKVIYNFLGESEHTHKHKKKYFDPDVSSKNTGLWKNFKQQAEIKKIYNNLKEYCFEA